MMRYFFSLLCFVQFLALPVAQAHDDVRLGVVNIVAVEQNSIAWQKKIGLLQEQFEENRETIVKEEALLKKQIEEYEKQRPLLSVEQQQEREAEINTQVAAIQNKAAELNGKLEQDSALSNQALRIRIAEIIQELALERKLDLILEVSEENFSIVFYTERLQITTEVTKHLNETYPTIIVE